MREDDEAVCLPCGYREPFSRPDPFTLLLDAARQVGEALGDAVKQSGERSAILQDQVDRVERAIKALTDEPRGTGRRGRKWSDDARRAQSERMQARTARPIRPPGLSE